VVSTKSSIKSLVTVALLALLALVAGCGGGGAKDPFASTPLPALVVNPGSLNVYSGTPAVVTITSGVGPFQVFTSDAVVLPVTQVVSGAAITLVANSVPSDAAVTLTVQDAAGQRTAVSVVVKPSPLIGTLSVVPTSNTTCSGVTNNVIDKAAICSGESGLASVVLRSNAVSALPNRQVRFDVVQGAYNFVTNQAGTTFAKTITVVTDQNGKADAVIRTDAAASSQAALIRVTDVTSGNRVDGSFTIVQAIDGRGVLSVVPTAWEVTGYFKDECPGGSVDYLIYGGQAPYTVTNSLPSRVALSANGVSSVTSVIVPEAGGRFSASSVYTQGCVAFEATFVIADATGRIVNATYKVTPGTRDRVATKVTPSDISVKANGAGRCVNSSWNYAASSGVGPLMWSISVSPLSATLSATNGLGVTLTLTGFGIAAGEIITLSAIDNAGAITTATFTCTAATGP
jgi:hypothetical protein